MSPKQVHRTQTSQLLGALQETKTTDHGRDREASDACTALQSLAHEHAQEIAADDLGRIASILHRNLHMGRVQRVMAKQFGITAFAQQQELQAEAWRAYQWQVVQIYGQEYTHVRRLAENDCQEWERFWDALSKAARVVLLRCCIACAAAEDQALDAAQQACEQIYVSIFPFDTPFDRWAHTILRNCIYQVLTRSHDLLDRNPYVESLDELERRGAVYDPVRTMQFNDDPYSHSNQMSSLLDAIERIRSKGRRRVLIYSYFEDLDDREIAGEMGCSTSGVYLLRHRALKQLRSLLDDDE